MKEELYSRLYGLLPIAVLVTDSKGQIVYHNAKATALLGDPLSGHPVSALTWPGELQEGPRQSTAVQLALDPGATAVQLKSRDNRRLLASCLRIPLEDGLQVYFIRDVTAQIEYISKVRQQQNTEQELYRSSNIRSGDLQAALKEIILRSSETMQVKRVNIWEIDEGFNSIRSLINYDAGRGGFLDNIVLYRHQFPNYFSLMQTEEIIPTPDALNDPKTQEIRESYIVPLGIRALLDAPVRIAGKMVGVLCFEDTDRTREWDASEQRFSVAIAQVVAQTLETHRRQSAQHGLEQALSEKKLLLAEVNHRIKNNFSLISDLVRLQEGKAQDDFHRRLFAEIRTRLSSMAMIHRQLYMSDNIGAVSVRDFLLDLVAHFRSTFAPEGVEITTMLDNCRLPIGKAILCGLVVNELLTNSCRHAFSKQEKGLVRLQLTAIGDRIEIIVSDNGKPEPEANEGIGGELVNELIHRLGAIMEKSYGEGTKTTLSFGN